MFRPAVLCVHHHQTSWQCHCTRLCLALQRARHHSMSLPPLRLWRIVTASAMCLSKSELVFTSHQQLLIQLLLSQLLHSVESARWSLVSQLPAQLLNPHPRPGLIYRRRHQGSPLYHLQMHRQLWKVLIQAVRPIACLMPALLSNN